MVLRDRTDSLGRRGYKDWNWSPCQAGYSKLWLSRPWVCFFEIIRLVLRGGQKEVETGGLCYGNSPAPSSVGRAESFRGLYPCYLAHCGREEIQVKSVSEAQLVWLGG